MSRISKALRILVGAEDTETERLHVQLAGCSVAALGWNKNPAVRGDYGWSPAYQDVLDLRRKYEAMLQPEAQAEHDSKAGVPHEAS
jgi:non-ribosomal peptide synthetase component F